MSQNARIFNALLKTIAPAHSRRKRVRLNRVVAQVAEPQPEFLAALALQSPVIAPQSAAQLQAAYNARCADEARSSLA